MMTVNAPPWIATKLIFATWWTQVRMTWLVTSIFTVNYSVTNMIAYNASSCWNTTDIAYVTWRTKVWIGRFVSSIFTVHPSITNITTFKALSSRASDLVWSTCRTKVRITWFITCIRTVFVSINNTIYINAESIVACRLNSFKPRKYLIRYNFWIWQ